MYFKIIFNIEILKAPKNNSYKYKSLREIKSSAMRFIDRKTIVEI